MEGGSADSGIIAAGDDIARADMTVAPVDEQMEAVGRPAATAAADAAAAAATAAAAAPRLARLQRISTALLSSFGVLLRLARVSTDETETATDGVRVGAAGEQLVSAVSDLLALVAEVKLDAAVLAAGGREEAIHASAAAGGGGDDGHNSHAGLAGRYVMDIEA
jgi:hypothetical protein